jgi:succinoglycan biosynthesis transport protein ExoP
MVVVAILCGAVAFAVSSIQSKVYEAKASLLVGQALSASNPDYTQLLVAQNLSSTYAVVATTRQNLEAVIGQLSLADTPESLGDRVQVDSPSDSTLLTISAQDSSAAQAAAIANALAEQVIAASPSIQGRESEFQQSIDKDLAATQVQIDSTQELVDELNSMPSRSETENAQLTTLEGRLATLRSTYATLLSYSSGSATNLLTIIDPAVPPANAVLPRVALNTLLGAIFGLIAVMAVAFIAQQLDDSIKDPDTVEEVTGLSTLASISQMNTTRDRNEMYQLAAILYPRSSTTEAYRKLRASVEFASVDAPIRSILVTSAVPGEGKSVTAANLAVVFAQTGRNVVLIDADLRKPGVHALFNLGNAEGLTSLLRDESLPWESVAHTSEVPTLRVLTSGPLPPNPAELMGSQRMKTVLDHLKWSSDLLVLDSAPLMAVTDSAVLSTYTDGTLLVVDASKSRRRTVNLGRETLQQAGAKVLGVVLNRAATDPMYGAYYGTGHVPASASRPGRGTAAPTGHGPSPSSTMAGAAKTSCRRPAGPGRRRRGSAGERVDPPSGAT